MNATHVDIIGQLDAVKARERRLRRRRAHAVAAEVVVQFLGTAGGNANEKPRGPSVCTLKGGCFRLGIRAPYSDSRVTGRSGKRDAEHADSKEREAETDRHRWACEDEVVLSARLMSARSEEGLRQEEGTRNEESLF